MDTNVKKVKVTAEMLKDAKRVLEVMPSFHELMNSPEMSILVDKGIMHPLAAYAFRNSNEWEGISLAVNNMCTALTEASFDDGYVFPGGCEKGTVTINPAYGPGYEINSLTVYKALLIIMFCNWMEIEPFSGNVEEYVENEEKYMMKLNACNDFRYNHVDIIRILD